MITVNQYPLGPVWVKNTLLMRFNYSLVDPSWSLQVQFWSYQTGFICEEFYPFGATSGQIKIYPQDILNAALKYELPALNIAFLTTQSTSTVWKDFYILYRAWGPTHDEPLIKARLFRAIKGGMGDMSGNDYFINQSIAWDAAQATKFLPNDTRMMTWFPKNGKKIRPEETAFFLCHTKNLTVGTQKIEYKGRYLDGSIFVIYSPTYVAADSECIWVPYGVQQCNLDPLNKGVWFYTVAVVGPVIPAMPPGYSSFRIDVDNRPCYKPITLYWRNSFGGLDQHTFRGTNDSMAEGEKQETTKAMYDLEVASSQSVHTPYFDSHFKAEWKLNTGYISKECSAAMMDMLANNDAYFCINKNWIPVKVTNQKLNYHPGDSGLVGFDVTVVGGADYNVFQRELLSLLGSM